MASENGSEGETTPLSGVTTSAVIHRESVFSFALFMPALTRQIHGHYVTMPVIVAMILFFMTVACQLSLTLIAGSFITSQSSDFKVSLVRHESWHAQAMTPIDYVREAVYHGTEAAKDIRHEIMGSERSEKKCCTGADCVELHPCCGAEDRRGVSNRKASNSFLFHASRKPMDSAKQALNNTRHKFKVSLDDYVFGSSGDVALCRKGDDGLIDCTMPSYSYLDAWPELDDNGDGIWTSEEAAADRTNLGCRLGLSANDFFHSAIRGIIKDAKDTAENSYAIPLVPSSIEKRTGIPKAYFEHFKGLVVICAAVDLGRCGQLVKTGVFDGAIGLQHQATRGGIHDLDSALDFCQRMLRSGGVCDSSLPHTYQLYKSRIGEKCGSTSYEVGSKYVNPVDKRDAMSIVEVSYSEYGQYEEASQWQYQTFLFLILMVWYITLVVELSRIIELADLLNNIPSANDKPLVWLPENSLGLHSLSTYTLLKTPRVSGQQEEEEIDNVVEGLTTVERTAGCCMVAVRIYLWFYMGNVGTYFLLATFGYDDLLFNAVALAFIFELPMFLYEFLISDVVKKQLDGATSAEFPSSLPHGDNPLAVLISRAFWGLLIIPVFTFIVCYYNNERNVLSALEALSCACYQKGPYCISAARFSRDWWNQYWQDTFPLAKLRSSYLT